MKHCPQCNKDYTPELPPRPEGDRRMIQDIYPDAEPYQTEQLMSLGFCSDKCFDEALGPPRKEYTYDEKGRRFDKDGVRKLFADPPDLIGSEHGYHCEECFKSLDYGEEVNEDGHILCKDCAKK